jgi:hypothetical protein
MRASTSPDEGKDVDPRLRGGDREESGDDIVKFRVAENQEGAARRKQNRKDRRETIS